MIPLDTAIDPNEPKIYSVSATVNSPTTDDGMNEDPVHFIENQSRIRALQFAKAWSVSGYWSAVYNQRTNECVSELRPR